MNCSGTLLSPHVCLIFQSNRFFNPKEIYMNKTLTQSQALELFDQMTKFRNLEKETRTIYHSWTAKTSLILIPSLLETTSSGLKPTPPMHLLPSTWQSSLSASSMKPSLASLFLPSWCPKLCTVTLNLPLASLTVRSKPLFTLVLTLWSYVKI